MERLLTIEDKLRETFDYDKDTGKFFYKTSRPVNHFKTVSSYKRWHTLFSGKEINNPDLSGNTYYNKLNLDGVKHKAHRVAWLFVTGSWPVGEVDHINRDGLDNRFINLRDVSKVENMRNSSIKHSNKSGTKDVFQRSNGSWMARGHETRDGVRVRVYLGTFSSKDEAVNARLGWEHDQGDIF